MKHRVVIIVGTRPQIIKSAPVLKAFRATPDIDASIINTGQHYDYEMNERFFKELQLPDPEVNLGVGKGTPNEQVAGIVLSLEKHLKSNTPDLALVPGDTNSALAAGIACSKLGIKLAHLEAGCRSGDYRMAEELNRRVLDQISDVLLCPTKLCLGNLEIEKVLARVKRFVGDTMLDSLIRLRSNIDKSNALNSIDLAPGSYAFMTLHRAENVDNIGNLRTILGGIRRLKLRVIFAVHPRTRKRIKKFGLSIPDNITSLDPLSYLDTLKLIKESMFVITDSGGLQKEAYWLGKRSLVLRKNTEWIEIVNAGGSFLVGSGSVAIASGFERLKKSNSRRGRSGLFGDGTASEKTAAVISSYLSEKSYPPFQ